MRSPERARVRGPYDAAFSTEHSVPMRWRLAGFDHIGGFRLRAVAGCEFFIG
jgi:hypothetical protein